MEEVQTVVEVVVEEVVVEEEDSLDTLHPLEYLDSSLVHSTQVRKGKFHSLHNYKYNLLVAVAVAEVVEEHLGK